jgi:hypothetical protein
MHASKWCTGPVTKLIRKPVEDIYAGTQHPGLWCVVLAYTDLPVAKNVLVTAVHNAANQIPDGELKTKMLSLDVGMTVEQLDALLTWSEPLRRGPDLPLLHSVLYGATQVLKYEIPELMMKPINELVMFKAKVDRLTRRLAIEAFYEFLHGEVDLATWKGNYD